MCIEYPDIRLMEGQSDQVEMSCFIGVSLGDSENPATWSMVAAPCLRLDCLHPCFLVSFLLAF